jgi:uncharacterized protein YkwD
MLFFVASLALAGCEATSSMDGTGQPHIKVYQITGFNKRQITKKILVGVNELRKANGYGYLAYDSTLNLAASLHSKDMADQARPWHWGSDGSSPVDRAAKAGYQGTFLGEVISETYENEIDTLAAWAAQPDTMAILMNARANDLGFAWYQEPNGKIWWTLITAVKPNN